MAAAKVAPFCEMPLDEKTKIFYCRTGNHVPFQLFHLRHRLPGSAARIIAQNFASRRLASSFNVSFFLTFNAFTSFPLLLAWVKMGCDILAGYHSHRKSKWGQSCISGQKIQYFMDQNTKFTLHISWATFGKDIIICFYCSYKIRGIMPTQWFIDIVQDGNLDSVGSRKWRRLKG
jgi:hypothetical protein